MKKTQPLHHMKKKHTLLPRIDSLVVLCQGLSILFFVLLTSCNSQRKVFDEAKPYQSFRGFEPTDPTEYDKMVSIVENDKIVLKEIKLLKTEQILSFLNNETVLVSIGQLTAEGGFSYLPVVVSSKGSSYKVTMDYMKSATLPVKDSVTHDIIGLRRVGVGLRLISLITTFEAGINIGDLSSIGIATKAGKMSGTLMVEVIGIKSKDVTTLIPLPSEINQTTIQNAMQALATIKSKIYDDQTKLYPQIMAISDFKVNNTGGSVKKSGAQADSIAIDNKINLQFDSKNNKAAYLEAQGFKSLFDKEIDQAIINFADCSRAFPAYHSVFEIANYLRTEQPQLIDKNSPKWKDVYKTILTKYSWKLDADVLSKLKVKAN